MKLTQAQQSIVRKIRRKWGRNRPIAFTIAVFPNEFCMIELNKPDRYGIGQSWTEAYKNLK